MSRFLKLTGRIINISSISHIHFDQAAEKYTLNLTTTSHAAFFMFGTGSINSVQDQIYATKKDHAESYETIEKWVNSIECVANNKK